MVGSHTIRLWSKRVLYSLTVRRNITVITGNSGTGKSTFVSMLDRLRKDSSVEIDCDVPVKHLTDDNWEYEVLNNHNRIYVIDEDDIFIIRESVRFSEVIQRSSNYYIIITRNPLHFLPYSVKEIYEFYEDGRDVVTSAVYNKMRPILSKNWEHQELDLSQVSVIVTEDSKAGYKFFSSFDTCDCKSADGRDNIVVKVSELARVTNGEILVIADGAAFGSAINNVMEVLSRYPNVTLCLPESFEWLLLKAGIVGESELWNCNNSTWSFNIGKTKIQIGKTTIDDILSAPENYIESRYFFSWERFFNNILNWVTAGVQGKEYNKNKDLPWVYLSKGCKDKVVWLLSRLDELE